MPWFVFLFVALESVIQLRCKQVDFFQGRNHLLSEIE